ncbi:MAG: undecaprenyldiphospho-muramoylpentapeptide beta-N-acetylglucosaminyltransferase [Gammaproteobacteria bacterium]|nr:undecaprenyldiphospho-muramoylpentapeptide beta-N-acetylglucosaminyltransferase [Gammaproteobacteria bacterium]
MSSRIIFTGGGSAGHVVPNLAIINALQKDNWQSFYIGSKQGIERKIIGQKLPYFAIASGKLRRYFSWQNFVDPLKIFLGIVQSYFLIKKLKPKVVFSKGGFVSLPVVIAAWLNRVPTIIHESDLTPGLTNRLSAPFASKICLTFDETKKHLKTTNTVVTGCPIRSELLKGNPENGRAICGFNDDKKIILVIGGGLGSAIINKTIEDLLPKILANYQVVHICGKDKKNTLKIAGYKSFEYIYDELADIMACADLVISRAGSNTLYELLTLGKPHILIPLSKKSSRGDQIINANFFVKRGFSKVIDEDTLTCDLLHKEIDNLAEDLDETKQRLATFKKTDSIKLICDIITSVAEQ